MKYVHSEERRQTDIIIYMGKRYRKVEPSEYITRGALHSFDGGLMSPIMNEETIGDVPANFSPRRTFYNPID